MQQMREGTPQSKRLQRNMGGTIQRRGQRKSRNNRRRGFIGNEHRVGKLDGCLATASSTCEDCSLSSKQMYYRASNTSPLINVQIEGITDQVPTLIGSGASTNFLDIGYARKNNIPLIELDKPINVEAINEKNISKPIQFKAFITIKVEGRLFKKQNVHCMTTGNAALILGMRWLSEAQPEIKWAPFTLSFPEQGQTAKIEEIPEYIRDYADVLSKELFKELPPSQIFECEITFKAGATLPKPVRAYPLSPAEDRAMQEYIEAELASGKISPSRSPLAAPCFFVRKSIGTLRMVVDYRKINNITVKDSFPLPLITDLVEHTKGSKWFFKLDLRMGFSNLRVKEPWKTALVTKTGPYKCNVMPFGLCGAPPTFQRFITWPFQHDPELTKEEKELIEKCLCWYVNNVIGHAKSQEELVKVLQLVMKIFKQNHLLCKLSKCVFMVEKVDFIRFIIGRDGV